MPYANAAGGETELMVPQRAQRGTGAARMVLKSRPDARVVRRGDRVVKVSGRPRDLENQYRWLQHFAGLAGVPRVWSFARHGRFGVLVHDFVEGTPLHQEVERHPGEALPTVGKLVDMLSALRTRPVGEAAPLTRDLLRQHYVRNVTRRYANSLAWVPCLTADRFGVNGRTVRNPYTVVAERSERIVDLVAADAEVGPVHGEPHLSNVICGAEDGALGLLAPRGTFADRPSLSGDLNDDAARVWACMSGYSDIIENHGALVRSDSKGFEVEVEVTPVLRSIRANVVGLLTGAFPVSEEGLLVREALFYLGEVPRHAPDAFKVHAFLARGAERLADAGLT